LRSKRVEAPWYALRRLALRLFDGTLHQTCQRVSCKTPRRMCCFRANRPSFLDGPYFLIGLCAGILLSPLPSCAQPKGQNQQESPSSTERRPARYQVLAGDSALDLGQLDEAQRHYEEALALARVEQDVETEILALNQLGVLAERRESLRDALDLYTQALRLQQASEFSDLELPPTLNLASVHLALNQNQEARSFAERTIELAEDQEDFEASGLAHLVLGEIGERDGDYLEARSALMRASALLERARRPRHAAQARMLLGRLHLAHQELKSAVRELSSARVAFRATGDREGEVRCLAYLAVAYEGMEQPDVALTFWSRAVEVAREDGTPSWLRRQCLSEGLRVLRSLPASRRPEGQESAWETELADLPPQRR
jgi:tetratricopeptide (TPR) repeat protein